MAVTHPDPVRNAVADVVVDRLELGSGPGTLELQTAGNVEVATLTFSDPAFGSAVAGVATANAITADSSATGNASPVTKAVAKDSTGTVCFNCSVTATGSGGDIQLSGVTISAGQSVSLSTLTYTAPV